MEILDHPWAPVVGGWLAGVLSTLGLAVINGLIAERAATREHERELERLQRAHEQDLQRDRNAHDLALQLEERQQRNRRALIDEEVRRTNWQ